MSVLADTGALFGATEVTDEWHDRLRAWFSSTATAVIVPVTVLQETAYMINVRRGASAEAAFLRNFLRDEFVLEPFGVDDLGRAAELLDTYGDFPLGLVDASVVAIAERLDIRDLLTTDRRHFGVIRPAHCERLRLLP